MASRLLVSFWATWCEPCRDEYPLINELVKQYAPQGLTAIGVSLSSDAEMHLVRHFLAKIQPTFTNLPLRMGGVDEFDHGVDPTWPGELPVNFLFAADGKMIARLDGERPSGPITKTPFAPRSSPAPHHIPDV